MTFDYFYGPWRPNDYDNKPALKDLDIVAKSIEENCDHASGAIRLAADLPLSMGNFSDRVVAWRGFLCINAEKNVDSYTDRDYIGADDPIDIWFDGIILALAVTSIENIHSTEQRLEGVALALGWIYGASESQPEQMFWKDPTGIYHPCIRLWWD